MGKLHIGLFSCFSISKNVKIKIISVVYNRFLKSMRNLSKRVKRNPLCLQTTVICSNSQTPCSLGGPFQNTIITNPKKTHNSVIWFYLCAFDRDVGVTVLHVSPDKVCGRNAAFQVGRSPPPPPSPTQRARSLCCEGRSARALYKHVLRCSSVEI